MAIDYIIDFDCVPKQTLGTEGIKERLKGLQRAQLIIQIYRDNGDDRPPSEMGFDFTRQTAEGEEETQLIVVQDLLDQGQDLEPLRHHCANCPANRLGRPYGCMSFIQYPISGQAESWLLDQLPSTNEPLVWLLLKQGVDNFQYDGQQIALLRQQSDTYFEDRRAAVRILGEFDLNANQVFEMIFNVGDIIPNHAAMLLVFFNAVERSEMEAGDLMNMTPATEDLLRRYPFLHQNMPADDATTIEIKDFLHALYIAWALNVKLLVDA